jgi:hypothetical protein
LIPESTIGKTAAGITGALALGPRYSKELLKENLKNMSPGKAFVRSLTPGAAYRVGAPLLFASQATKGLSDATDLTPLQASTATSLNMLNAGRMYDTAFPGNDWRGKPKPPKPTSLVDDAIKGTKGALSHVAKTGKGLATQAKFSTMSAKLRDQAIKTAAKSASAKGGVAAAVAAKTVKPVRFANLAGSLFGGGVKAGAGATASTAAKAASMATGGARALGSGLKGSLAGTMKFMAAPTLGANLVLMGADKLGALAALPGVSREQSSKYTSEFVDGGIPYVPNLDPITATARGLGAEERLEQINIDRGLHGDSAYDKGAFVADQVTTHLGGDDPNLVQEAVGGLAGAAVTGVEVGTDAAKAVGGAALDVAEGTAKKAKKAAKWLGGLW